MRKHKWLETTITVIVAIVLVYGGFAIGWQARRQVPENIEVTGVANMTGNGSTTAPADFGTFWEAWNDINALYLRNPSTTDEQKIQGAINGMVSSLGDPYTEYFPPAGNTEFQQDLTGDFGGIGAELDTDDNGDIIISATLPGTPARTAGLMPKDVILDINGTSTASMSVDDAVDLIRGNVGTVVDLTIGRPGVAQPIDFKITRADINVPDVIFTMKGDIADIQLTEFTQDSDFEFYQALVQAEQNNAKGIVLDLRGDPGGYLEVAVNIAGYFLKPGTLVVKEVGRTVPEQDFTADGDGSLVNMPLVVLMDSGSASASEILAGALHDDRATPLIGTQSFGKGTVQQLEQLSDGSSIKITVAHWVLPSGEIIDHIGLTPTDFVTSTLSATSTVDAQLNKALQVIQGQIGG
jgi:carboxyl-terminal processing protease